MIKDNWMIDGLIGSMVDWLVGLMIDWLNGWLVLIDIMKDWLVDCLIGVSHYTFPVDPWR